MTNNPGSLFDQLRSITAAQIAEEAGLHLQMRGRRHWTYCPLHHERTPSMCFYEDGSWYCFGCNTGGRDGVSLYAAMNHIGMYEAAKQLAARHGIAVNPDRHKPQSAEKKPVDVSDALKTLKDWEHARWSRLYEVEQYAQRVLDGFPASDAAWDDPRFVTALRARMTAGMELDQMTTMGTTDLIQLFKQEGMKV